MLMAKVQYTPTEERMLTLLKDGHPHVIKELKIVAGDDGMNDNAVQVHLCNIRKKLREDCQDIMSTYKDWKWQYQLVWLSPSAVRNNPLDQLNSH